MKYAQGTTPVQEYIWFGRQLLATENSNNGAPCGTCYFVWDHLGSKRLVLDQYANVIARHDYLPFGEEIPAGYAGRDSSFGVNDSLDQKFTGQQRDGESGEDNFNARYFARSMGRFMSPDPMNVGAVLTDPQTWNAYSYVRNNPMGLVDPSGMSLCNPKDPSAIVCVQNDPPKPKSPAPPPDTSTLDELSRRPCTSQECDPSGTSDPIVHHLIYARMEAVPQKNSTARPASCAGKTAGDLNYNVSNSLGETGQQHIQRLHMALLSGNQVPNMKSQYLFTPPGSANDNWQLVVAINAYIFNNPSSVLQNSPKSNIVFTGAVPPEALLPDYPGYLVSGNRFQIGLERLGNAFGLPRFGGTNVGTLVTQSDCSSVRSAYPGRP